MSAPGWRSTYTPASAWPVVNRIHETYAPSFQRATLRGQFVLDDGTRGSGLVPLPTNLIESKLANASREHSVLVGIGDDLGPAKRGVDRSRQSAHSTVKLQTLDLCQCWRAYESLLYEGLAAEVARAFADGELDDPLELENFPLTQLAHRQLPDKVIERGDALVRDLPDQGAEAWGRFFDDLEAGGVPHDLRVWIGDDLNSVGVSAEKLVGLILKRFNVFTRPIPLGVCGF